MSAAANVATKPVLEVPSTRERGARRRAAHVHVDATRRPPVHLSAQGGEVVPRLGWQVEERPVSAEQLPTTVVLSEDASALRPPPCGTRGAIEQ